MAFGWLFKHDHSFFRVCFFVFCFVAFGWLFEHPHCCFLSILTILLVPFKFLVAFG